MSFLVNEAGCCCQWDAFLPVKVELQNILLALWISLRGERILATETNWQLKKPVINDGKKAQRHIKNADKTNST